MRRAPLVIALLAMPALVVAAQPSAAPGVQAEAMRSRAPSLGRLFYTPAERAELDIARRAKPTPQAPQAEAPRAPPPPQVVSYGGIVRRSDGKAMLWINNRLVEEKEALEGLNLKGKVRPNGAVTLQVPETGGSIEVKVGQSVEVHSGKVAETRKQREATAAKAAREQAPAGAPATPAAEAKADAANRTGPAAAGAAVDAAQAPASGAIAAKPNEDSLKGAR